MTMQLRSAKILSAVGWWIRGVDRSRADVVASGSDLGLVATWNSLSTRARLFIMFAALVWGFGIALGTSYSVQYEITAGDVETAKNRWPVGSQCTLSSSRPTLVIFLHPRCFCSRASVAELSVLMKHCQGQVDAQVVFLQPDSLPSDWSQTDLWDSVAAVPGVTVRRDDGGIEHRRFNARVSGEVFLYQPNGELSFHGGITAKRGHSGDNRGRSAIESLILNQVSHVSTTPVYGCDLESRCTISGRCGVNEEEVR